MWVYCSLVSIAHQPVCRCRRGTRCGLKPLLKLPNISTDNALILLAVLHQNKSRHRPYFIFPSDRFHILYIDLEEQNILIFLCESTDLRGHLLARSAVGCIEINENWTGGYQLFEGLRTVCVVTVASEHIDPYRNYLLHPRAYHSLVNIGHLPSSRSFRGRMGTRT